MGTCFKPTRLQNGNEGGLLTFEVVQDLVLKNENVLVFVFLLDFDGDILVEHLVVGLVYETEGALAQLVADGEAIRYLDAVLVHVRCGFFVFGLVHCDWG